MHSSALEASRVLMGDSLGFHIIFVLFGLTLPILVSWFEWMGIRRNDKKLIDTAHFWSKIMAVLVITGVISGTIIALQMSLVWPGILEFGGKVIGLPFMFETYAFLIEATFLALYMATWNRKKISQYTHFIFGLFVVLGSTMSAYAITSVNAWMNLPTGFTFVQGKLQDIDVFHAMFSETALIEFFHSMPGYYIAATLAIAGLYGCKLLRDKPSNRLTPKHKLDWFIIRRLVLFATVALLISMITGDITGKYLAKHEPAKLATIEIVNTTSTHVPLVFGGFENSSGKTVGPYFKIPNALSLLVGNSPNAEVIGLESTPKNQRPPSYIRALFNIKLTLIGVMMIGIAAYFALNLWRPEWLSKSWLLITMSACAGIGIVLVELGWIITEVGRQPWAVRGYVTTEQAVTKTHDITKFGYFFPLSYVLLFAVTVLAIRKIVRDKKGTAI